MLLHRLYELDSSSGQLPDLLHRLLCDKEYIEGLQKLPKAELIQVVDYLDDVLGHLDRTSQPFRKCFQMLRKICSSRAILPTSYQVSGVVSFASEVPAAPGGFSDAYRGTLSTGADVCIKRLRMYARSDKKALQQSFCKEAVVWKHLNHPNIVPFIGVTLESLQLVSGWMPGGELRNYLKASPQANRIILLLGVAEGLAYLHSCNVIHGDLKGPNIIVDECGNARITDFGLAAIARDPHSQRSTLDEGYTARWCAPEILEGEQLASRESDIFSFGMVMVEVYTGKAPFVGHTTPTVILSIVGGDRPARPSDPTFTDRLWELTQRCLKQDPSDRPNAEQTVEILRKLANRTSPTLSTPLGQSPEQKPVPTSPSAIPLRTPDTRHIPPRTSTNGGGSVPPDQAGAQPSQTLDGGANDPSRSTGDSPSEGRRNAGTKPSGGSPGNKCYGTSELNNEKRLNERSNGSRKSGKVSVQWCEDHSSTPPHPSIDLWVPTLTPTPSEAVPISIRPKLRIGTKRHGLWCRIRRFKEGLYSLAPGAQFGPSVQG